jgi:hypothetical protein
VLRGVLRGGGDDVGRADVAWRELVTGCDLTRGSEPAMRRALEIPGS